MEDFKGVLFTASVGDKQVSLSPYDKPFGENYPIRDKCNQKKDPKGGCITTGAYYYTANLEYEGKTTTVVLTNTKTGIVVFNATYKTSKVMGKTWDTMGCNSVETCKPICDKYEGELIEKSRVCMFDAYLNEVCYRVIKGSGDYYVIDVPPAWYLYPETSQPGCE